jgi:hypothetical protein
VTPTPWQIISDGDRKTLRVMRWKQSERDANGYLSSERETAPQRFRSRRTAQAWIDAQKQGAGQ